MLIIASDNSMYCRIKFNVGPGVEKIIPVMVDYSVPFASTNHELWKQEYDAKVSKFKPRFVKARVMTRFGNPPIPGAIVKRSDEEDLFPEEADHACWWDPDYKEAMGFSDKEDPVNELSDDETLDFYWDGEGRVNYWDDDNSDWYEYDPLDGKWYTNDDIGEDSIEIKAPKQPWAINMVKWANENRTDRMEAMKEHQAEVSSE